jgi:hypothetical protein
MGVQLRALPNVAQRSWVSGYNGHYKSVLGAAANAKSVTSPLIIPSVLAFRAFYFTILSPESFVFLFIQSMAPEVSRQI